MSEHRCAVADVQQRLPDFLPGNLVDASVEELAESALNELDFPEIVLKSCQSRWDKIFAKYSVSSFVTDEEFDTTVHSVNMHSYELVAVGGSQSPSEKSSTGNPDEENGIDCEGDNVSEHSEQESVCRDGTGELTERNKEKSCQSCSLLDSESVNKHQESSEKYDEPVGVSVASGKEQRYPEGEEDEADDEREEDIGTETETEYEEERLDFLESEKKKFINNWLQSSSFHTLPPHVPTTTQPHGTKQRWKPVDDFAREMALIQHSLNETEPPSSDPNLPDLEGWHSLAPEENVCPETIQTAPGTPNVLEEINAILGDFVPTPVSPMNDESPVQEDLVFAQFSTRGDACLEGYRTSFNAENNETHAPSMQETLGFAEKNETVTRLNVVEEEVAVERPAVILDAPVENAVLVESGVMCFDPHLQDEVTSPNADGLSEAARTRGRIEALKIVSGNRSESSDQSKINRAGDDTSPKRLLLCDASPSIGSDVMAESLETSVPDGTEMAADDSLPRKQPCEKEGKLPCFETVQSRLLTGGSGVVSRQNASRSKGIGRSRKRLHLSLHSRAKLRCNKWPKVPKSNDKYQELEIVCSSSDSD